LYETSLLWLFYLFNFFCLLCFTIAIAIAVAIAIPIAIPIGS
jgi:hypothetical protein